MSTPFQNRLVGTVIIAAAAVIFLPDLLDGKKQAYQADFENIPEAPGVISPPSEKHTQIKTITTNIDHDKALTNVFEKQKYNQTENNTAIKQKIPTQSTNTQITNNTSNVKVNTLTKEPAFKYAAKAKAKTNTPSVTPSQKVEQWVVQLGSFRHEKNVNVLVNKLKKQNFNVFTKPIKTKNGSLTKVFVGPETQKSTLEKKLNALKTLTGVNGKVARY